MKIITINVPVSYLKAIDTLTGNKGLYPSRSELIRVAVRDFLIHELESAEAFRKMTCPIDEVVADTPDRVKVRNEHGGYTTYKIIKKKKRSGEIES